MYLNINSTAIAVIWQLQENLLTQNIIHFYFYVSCFSQTLMAKLRKFQSTVQSAICMAVGDMNYLINYLLNMNCWPNTVSGFPSEAYRKLNPHTHIGHMDKTLKVISVRIPLLKIK